MLVIPPTLFWVCLCRVSGNDLMFSPEVTLFGWSHKTETSLSVTGLLSTRVASRLPVWLADRERGMYNLKTFLQFSAWVSPARSMVRVTTMHPFKRDTARGERGRKVGDGSEETAAGTRAAATAEGTGVGPWLADRWLQGPFQGHRLQMVEGCLGARQGRAGTPCCRSVVLQATE